jgi:hypothetical protein
LHQGGAMKVDLDMTQQEWKVLRDELRRHMSYMGVTCSDVDPWDVFYKVTEAIEDAFK